MPRPPARVLTAFGIRGSTAERLGGGQGRAWTAGGLILKPVDDAVETLWVAEVLSGLAEDGFRINRPVPAAAGEWVVEGWSAWEALAGEHDTAGRWPDVLAVGTRLNAALSGLPRPAFLDARTHAWAVGDRAAWDEEPADPVHDALRPLLERLRTHVRPDDGRGQVIHGDLAGNVLFAPGLAPGVIDFTPYWRPPLFCLAVVVVDALLWHGAPPTLTAAMPSVEDRASLLARAAIYRLITSDRLAADMTPSARHSYLGTSVLDHERVLGVLDR
ncbi:MAG: hypothetical protein JWQ99_3891 [Blastococcus sp.]|jgi:uncharacterized protein (TIGR02569 family)|nr:hypothetical protein [Blastococcus sp.]